MISEYRTEKLLYMGFEIPFIGLASECTCNYQTFNKTQAKSSFGHHVGGQECALPCGGQYKSYYFVENQSAIKCLP